MNLQMPLFQFLKLRKTNIDKNTVYIMGIYNDAQETTPSFDITEKNSFEKILKDWKKDKKLPDDVNLQIINAVLRRSIVKALSLSEELQLPPPIALPFAKKPSINFIKPSEVVNIVDETNELKDQQDITPMGLANLVVEMGEEDVLPSLMRKITKTLQA